jgi:putative SOS response-associated peptidase YedK
MCGRYALAALKDEIISDFGITDLTPTAAARTLPADWNIAPTKEIYLIKGEGEERTLDIASWGLIAPWSKTEGDALRSQSMAINARIETVHEKPTFRDSFKVRRCLVPASGYYEWATELGQYPRKQPIFISPEQGKFLAFAGIYNYWRSPEVGRASESHVTERHVTERQSVAIITREAVNDLAKVHHRMPLFLPVDRWQRWLESDTSIPEVMDILKVKQPDENLRFWPVAARVNSIRNNGPELISPIELGESETLF